MKKIIIENVLKRFTEDYATNRFIPILEADVVGYFYHLLILEIGDVAKIHLDTRICQFGNNKFDLVIGDVCYSYKRPCIENPGIVIEFKAFPVGFTSQQHHVHYRHVIEDDVPKLAVLSNIRGDRYMLLFDEDNYLKGIDEKVGRRKIERITKLRDEVDPKIKVIYITRQIGKLKWKIL